MGEASSQLFCVNGETEDCCGMPPAYDLILERDGQLITHTVQVEDAFEAWRLARERYPTSIRGVVCCDPQHVHPIFAAKKGHLLCGYGASARLPPSAEGSRPGH